MGGHKTKFENLREEIKSGVCYLISHKYAESQAQIEDWNEQFGFHLPLWWWDAYVHLFIAYFDKEQNKILPTRYPLACTNNIAKQVDLTTADMVFESDSSVLNNLEKFEKNKTIYQALPQIITAEKIKKFDRRLFESLIKKHRAGQFKYSFRSNKNAKSEGCCQLYARSLLEASGVKDYKKIKLPRELSILGWHNRGRLRI